MEKYAPVCAVIKSALWQDKTEFNTLSDIEYQEIYDELSKHCVECLTTDVWMQCDERFYKRIFKSALNNVLRWQKIMTEQERLVLLLEKEDIPFVILKGAAANIYYQKPEYRRMGDIDFIVKPGDFERTFQIMLENGYVKLEGNKEKHIGFIRNEVLFELHRNFGIMYEAGSRELLNEMIYSKLDYPDMHSLEGYRFPVLPKLENGLVLLYHICQHLEAGIGLRQIVDWMLYVNVELDDTFWDEEFCEYAKKLNMDKLAIVVTQMCQIYLGLRKDITWCKKANKVYCDQLMALIMESGNFGVKMPKIERTSMQARSVRAYFNLIHENGEKNWKLVKKYPWLKPVSWIYQLIKIIKHLCVNKTRLSQLICEMNSARKKKQLLKALGATRRYG